jgi:hypothetical protein
LEGAAAVVLAAAAAAAYGGEWTTYGAALLRRFGARSGEDAAGSAQEGGSPTFSVRVGSAGAGLSAAVIPIAGLLLLLICLDFFTREKLLSFDLGPLPVQKFVFLFCSARFLGCLC